MGNSECKSACGTDEHVKQLSDKQDISSIKDFPSWRVKIIGKIAAMEGVEVIKSPVSGRKCVAFNVEVRRDGIILMAQAEGHAMFSVYDDTKCAIVHVADEIGLNAGEHAIYGCRRMFDMKPEDPAAQ